MLVPKNSTLNGILNPFCITEKLYFLTILRGFTEIEARDTAKGLGTDIDRYLLDPDFSAMRQHFLDNGWKRSEVDQEWKDLIVSHYTDLVIMAGIKEISKAKDRDNVVLKEATKVAIAQRNRVPATQDSSYDELILKKKW